MRKPVLVVIIGIHDLQSERLRIAGALVLADLVFLLREDVRIAVIYHRCDAVLKQTLYDCT